MLKTLTATPNDFTLTLLRLVAGVVFFAHGAQLALGWFGGYGYSATMGFFTQQLHIPAPFAFLAIAAQLLGGLGLIAGFIDPHCRFWHWRNNGYCCPHESPSQTVCL